MTTGRYRAAYVCVLAISLAASIRALADGVPVDDRSLVKIVIITADKASVASGPVLRNKLRAERFAVTMGDTKADPLGLLQNKETSHIIELRDKIASVYTRNAPQPRVRNIEEADVSQLHKKIQRYLTSPDVINMRLAQMSEQTHFAKGYRFAAEDKYELALAEFLQEMRVNSKNADLYYNLAWCYRRMGKPKEESETVNKGRALDPEHSGLKNPRALMALDGGDADGAIEILSDLPDEPLFQWNLALAYARKGDLKKAQQYYKRIVEGQVDPAWTSEAEQRIVKLNEEIAAKDKMIQAQGETIQRKEATIGEKQTTIESQGAGLRIVGWSSLIATIVLVAVGAYYAFTRKLRPLLNAIPGSPSEKLAFFGPILVAVITLVGNVLVVAIK